MSGKRYVPEGVYLVCDKGAKPSELKSLSYKETTLFGEHMTTKVDKVLNINFDPFGPCSMMNGSTCTAPITDWTNLTDSVRLGGNELLLENSELPCTLGGKIKIFYSMQDALGACPKPKKGFWATVLGIHKKYEEFKVGVAKGLWKGLKGTVTGIADLAVWAGKHTSIYATLNPQGFAEQIQKDKETLKSLGNLAKKGGKWAYRNSAINLITNPNDYVAAQAENKVMMDKLIEKAKTMDAEDWGMLTGEIGFEIILEVATAGGAAALTTIKVADKTVDAARALDKLNDLDNALDTAKGLEKIEDGTSLPSGPIELDDVFHYVDDMAPGSPAHKAQRWDDYLERGGEWDFDRWSKTYENNMLRAKKANKAVDSYHNEIGWGKREVTIDVDGKARRLDIADADLMKGVEMKSGNYFSRTKDILSEIARDKKLVERGWEIDWVIEGKASKPLIEELNSAGIKVIQR